MIGTPCGDQCQTFFMYDLVNMVGSTVSAIGEDVNISFFVLAGTVLAESRIDLAKKALEQDADYILYIDSDMRFPPDALVRLIKRDVPIAACNYTTRRPPAEPVTYVSIKEGKKLWTLPESEGMEECSATGFGFVLIHTSVFKAMEKPWFYNPYIPEADGFWSEDVWFCNQARKAGFPTMIDHDLSKEIKHIGAREYDYLDAYSVMPEVKEMIEKKDIPRKERMASGI